MSKSPTRSTMINKEEEEYHNKSRELIYQATTRQFIDEYKHEQMDFSSEPNGSDNSGKRFVCDICDATFTMIGNLNRHKKGHSNHRPYTCDFCLRGFLRRTSYIEHIRLHTGEKPYKCATCHQTFVRKKCHQMHIRKCSKVLSHSGLSQREPEVKQQTNFSNTNRQSHISTLEKTNTDEPLDLSAKTLSYLSFKERTSMLHPFHLKNMRLLQPMISFNPDRKTAGYEVGATKQLHSHSPQYPKDLRKSNQIQTNTSSEMKASRKCSSLSHDGDSESSDQESLSSVERIYETQPVSLNQLQANDTHLWPCKHCQIYFADRNLYIKHMTMHDDKNPMICTVCSRLCKDAHEFLIHH